MANQQKRQTAYKTQIIYVINGKFVKEGGWNPNYVIDDFGRKISRINLISTIVDLPETENTFNYHAFILDDGTGRIGARIFEDSELLKKFNIGNIVQVIGRIREYGTERYLIPEIIKKVGNPKWIDVRKKEIEMIRYVWNKKQGQPGSEMTEKKSASDLQASNEDVQEDIKEGVVDTRTESVDSSEMIISIIRELDNGGGADIDEVIKKCGLKSGEELINSLLLEVDILEIKPGKLKVLD